MDTEIVVTSGSSLWLEVCFFFFLIICSAFFSASETALTSASRARMTAMAQKGNKRAHLVNALRSRKEKLIGGLLLGNNFINTWSAAFATSVCIRLFGENGIALATVFVTIAVLVFAEVMPKTYALMYPDKLSLVVARPVSFVVAILSPVILAVSKTVSMIFHIFRVDKKAEMSVEEQEEELRGAIALFKEGERTNGEMSAEAQKSAMLHSILDLAEVPVESVMVHRKNVQMIYADASIEQIVDTVMQSAYTRLPVWRDNPDNVIGVLHAKLLLTEMRHCNGDLSRIDLSKSMMEPWFIPETTTLADQLQAFRLRREHFALIVDEYGALYGVVTLEDILEEIVGEIDDEHDDAAIGIKAQGEDSYLVEGHVTIRDLNRHLHWRLSDGRYDTVAGLLLYESQSIPAVGQVYTFHGVRFEILKKNRNQITQVLLTPESAHAQRSA